MEREPLLQPATTQHLFSFEDTETYGTAVKSAEFGHLEVDPGERKVTYEVYAISVPDYGRFIRIVANPGNPLSETTGDLTFDPDKGEEPGAGWVDFYGDGLVFWPESLEEALETHNAKAYLDAA